MPGGAGFLPQQQWIKSTLFIWPKSHGISKTGSLEIPRTLLYIVKLLYRRVQCFLGSDSDGFSWGKNVGCGEGGPHLIHMYPRSWWGPLPADFSRFVMFYRSPALTMRRCLRKVQAARASMCTKKGGEVLLKVEQNRTRFTRFQTRKETVDSFKMDVFFGCFLALLHGKFFILWLQESSALATQILAFHLSIIPVQTCKHSRLCIRFLDILGQSSTSLCFDFYIEHYVHL